MTLFSILVIFAALQHFGFMVLEMFFWDHRVGRKVFRMDAGFSASTKHLAVNQGVYNGFLAAALLVGFFHPQSEAGMTLQIFGLACIVVAAIAGAVTVSWRILLIQGLPAALALLTYSLM